MGPFTRAELSAFTLLMRLGLGSLMLFAAVNKFLADGSILDLARGMAGSFDKTFLPNIMVLPYAVVLPFAEAVIGAMLIAGLFTRHVMFVNALLLLSLAFGKIALQDYPTVANNLVYVFLAGVAFLASRWNDYSVDALMFGKRDKAA